MLGLFDAIAILVEVMVLLDYYWIGLSEFLPFSHLDRYRGCPRGVMVKAMDSRIVVREFVLQSRYCVHFRENTLGKSMNPLILPAMG